MRIRGVTAFLAFYAMCPRCRCSYISAMSRDSAGLYRGGPLSALLVYMRRGEA